MNEKKFVVVDYFDVWETDENVFEVNDTARTDYVIGLNDDDDDSALVEKLVTVGYLKDSVNKDVLNIEWLDDTMCEISQESNMYPICRLELVKE